MNKSGTATFTGQHKNVVENKETNDCHELEGLIVSSIGDKYISYTEHGEILDNFIHINECLPKLKITNKSKDKGVYGVITTSTNQSNIYGEEDDDILENNPKISSTLFGRLRTNSVGEGGIWVCNINGNLENGDYITSSSVPGYGELQDDDLLHNYTVAKITCHCDFDNLPDWIQTRHINENGEIQDSPSTYIAAFVGCTYHCG